MLPTLAQPDQPCVRLFLKFIRESTHRLATVQVTRRRPFKPLGNVGSDLSDGARGCACTWHDCFRCKREGAHIYQGDATRSNNCRTTHHCNNALWECVSNVERAPAPGRGRFMDPTPKHSFASLARGRFLEEYSKKVKLRTTENKTNTGQKHNRF